MDFFVELEKFFGSELFGLVIMPVFIVLARVTDVSLGTLRIILIAKGYRKIAPMLGFFESFIWILAVSQIMKNLDNLYYFVMYASGFALGTYFGMFIESKLSLGEVIVRVITKYDASELVSRLISDNYNLTTIDADGQFGKVKIIFMVLKREYLSEALQIIKQYNPNAFYTVEDVKFVREGSLPGMNNYPFRGKKDKINRAFSMKK